MEHLNKSTKCHGGISGIISCPKTLLKLCLTAHRCRDRTLGSSYQHINYTTPS
ncbi:hypothetical protein LSAT2_019461, partial [Lamellibrachia satsuma]